MTDWNPETVAMRLQEAARTAHRLPPVRVQGYFNLWPPFARTEFERMSCEDSPMVRFPPSPAEVERMLEVMVWMQWLEVDQRKLLWMRAEKYDWNEIGRRFGCCRTTAWRKWKTAITLLATYLEFPKDSKAMSRVE